MTDLFGQPAAPMVVAAAVALLVLLADLIAPGRWRVPLAVAVLGTAGTGAAAWFTYHYGDTPQAFCVTGAGCSYRYTPASAVIAIAFAGLTFAVLLLSASVLRDRVVPAGEYCFLLACSLTGGVALSGAADLITLIVALETLTLPLYILVGLRRRSPASAEGAITFFLISVVATTITLLGAALLYGLTGTVYLDGIQHALAGESELRQVPLTAVAVLLILVGLVFKVAAVPFHAWAPAAYDGAPLPIAAYLSTASKVGGVIALLYVSTGALTPWLDVVGPALAVLAVLTMTVGNLVALRQRRMVRLLAWSSIAQAGYLLAPLGAFAVAAGRTGDAIRLAIATTITYTIFYVLLEIGAFAGVIALRGAGDGGELADYGGTAQRSPWLAAALMLALAGLAGLPPGLAGLFAKVAVVRSLLTSESGWLAVIVALNAVIGLAYYVRAARALFGRAVTDRPKPAWSVGAVLTLATATAIVVGFAPQLIFDVADLVAGR
jgi:NADH-quinone oxidoreductase subunit N